MVFAACVSLATNSRAMIGGEEIQKKLRLLASAIDRQINAERISVNGERLKKDGQYPSDVAPTLNLRSGVASMSEALVLSRIGSHTKILRKEKKGIVNFENARTSWRIIVSRKEKEWQQRRDVCITL